MSSIRVIRGDTLTFNFTLTTDDDPPQPQSLVNKTLWLTVKRGIDDLDEDALIQVSQTFPNDLSSQNGVGSLVVPSDLSDTLPIPSGDEKFYYDFQLTDASSNPPIVETLDMGTWIVKPDRTRRVS